MNFTQDQIIQKYRTLPEDIRRAIVSVKTAGVISSIATRYNLTEQQTTILAKHTGFLMMGLTDTTGFVSTLVSGGVVQQNAQNISSDVKVKILDQTDVLVSDWDKEEVEEETVVSVAPAFHAAQTSQPTDRPAPRIEPFTRTPQAPAQAPNRESFLPPLMKKPQAATPITPAPPRAMSNPFATANTTPEATTKPVQPQPAPAQGPASIFAQKGNPVALNKVAAPAQQRAANVGQPRPVQQVRTFGQNQNPVMNQPQAQNKPQFKLPNSEETLKKMAGFSVNSDGFSSVQQKPAQNQTAPTQNSVNSTLQATTHMPKVEEKVSTPPISSVTKDPYREPIE